MFKKDLKMFSFWIVANEASYISYAIFSPIVSIV